VTVVEAAPILLPRLPERIGVSVKQELERIGVRVRVGTRVAEVTGAAVVTSDGEAIPADISVWAAGVKAPGWLAETGFPVDHLGRIEVNADLTVKGHDNVFAIGDCCYFKEAGAERPIPPRAQAAHQMASTVYDNLTRLMENKPLREFEYRDHGSLVSLSRFSTVGSLMGNLVGGNMAVEGRLARLVYVSLYRMHLLAIHGWLRGVVFILMARFNNIVRPKLKLH